MSDVLILTGASQGIGAQVLERAGEVGFDCIALGRRKPAGVSGFVTVDLSEVDAVSAAARTLREMLDGDGRRCCLVNNAGGGWPQPVAVLDQEVILAELTLNLAAPMLLSRALLPQMTAVGTGAIVNVASTAARTGVPFLSVYSAAKAGVIAFTQSLASEVADTGITVNCVCPGTVATPGAAAGRRELSALTGKQADEYERGMAARNGLGRLVDPGEVADVILWLATEAPPAVTGQALNVCGTIERQ